jgi:methanogenic corrinoid protein MtbC1
VPSPADVEAAIGLIEQRRTGDVVEVARALAVDRGIDEAIAFLAAVQVDVGRRWQTREWTVADEHAATAIVDVALTAAALAADAAQLGSNGAVVVSCVEDEWHVLPARMFAEQLKAIGWDVVFLGASVPAEHLSEYLGATPAAAVALSCSVPLHLPGARRSIDACHGAGVPVVIGGAALGADARRAEALGADAWARSATDASRSVLAWRASPPPPMRPRGDDAAQVALAAIRPQVVQDAYRTLEERFPALATFRPAQRARTVEDLDYILRYVESAILCGDDSIVTELVVWLLTVLDTRGLPPYTLALSLDVLTDTLPAEHTSAHRVLRAAKTAARRDAPA